MTIFDFPTGLVPLLEDASGCFFDERSTRNRSAGGRGISQIIRHDHPGTWRQAFSLNLSQDQWRELKAVIAALEGGVHQLRAPDFYQMASRHHVGWSGQVGFGPGAAWSGDGRGLPAAGPPSIQIVGAHSIGARTIAIRSLDQRHLILRRGDHISIGGRLDELVSDVDVGTSELGTLNLRRGLLSAASDGAAVEVAAPSTIWELTYTANMGPRSRWAVSVELNEDLR